MSGAKRKAVAAVDADIKTKGHKTTITTPIALTLNSIPYECMWSILEFGNVRSTYRFMCSSKQFWHTMRTDDSVGWNSLWLKFWFRTGLNLVMTLVGVVPKYKHKDTFDAFRLCSDWPNNLEQIRAISRKYNYPLNNGRLDHLIPGGVTARKAHLAHFSHRPTNCTRPFKDQNSWCWNKWIFSGSRPECGFICDIINSVTTIHTDTWYSFEYVLSQQTLLTHIKQLTPDERYAMLLSVASRCSVFGVRRLNNSEYRFKITNDSVAIKPTLTRVSQCINIAGSGRPCRGDLSCIHIIQMTSDRHPDDNTKCGWCYERDDD